MKLLYCDVPFGNFGDDLNTFLWPRLLPGAFAGTVRFWPTEQKPLDGKAPNDTLFMGIGTMLVEKVPLDGRKLVFGTGTGCKGRPLIDQHWDIHCVRGPLTAQVLGLPEHLAIADPAILVRLLPPTAAKLLYRTAFMPHWCQAQSGIWQKICHATGIHFIDPRWSVPRVLEDIAASGTLISEALHGAIVADALRVPWVAVSSKHHIQEFKWRDWCQSIGERYEPVHIPAIWSPRAGLAGRLATHGKMLQGGLVLTGLAHLARLSGDNVMKRLTARLVEKLEAFASDRALSLNLFPQL